MSAYSDREKAIEYVDDLTNIYHLAAEVNTLTVAEKLAYEEQVDRLHHIRAVLTARSPRKRERHIDRP